MLAIDAFLYEVVEALYILTKSFALLTVPVERFVKSSTRGEMIWKFVPSYATLTIWPDARSPLAMFEEPPILYFFNVIAPRPFTFKVADPVEALAVLNKTTIPVV